MNFLQSLNFRNFSEFLQSVSPISLFLMTFKGLSFPKIRNSDENLKLINFLRLSIFDRNTWTDDYANQNNISLFGEIYVGWIPRNLKICFLSLKLPFWQKRKKTLGWIFRFLRILGFLKIFTKIGHFKENRRNHIKSEFEKIREPP